MSKKTFKKGLALSTAASLVAGLGLFAFAASANAGEALYGAADRTRVTLTPDVGVDWAVTLGSTFSVKSDLPGINQALSEGTLKWLVESDDDDFEFFGDDVYTSSVVGTDLSLSDFTRVTNDVLRADFSLNLRNKFKFRAGDEITISGLQAVTTTVNYSDNYFDAGGTNGCDPDNDTAVDSAISTITIPNTTYTLGAGDIDENGNITLNDIEIDNFFAQGCGGYETGNILTTSWDTDFEVFLEEPDYDERWTEVADDAWVFDSRLDGSVNDFRRMGIYADDAMTIAVTAWADSNDNDEIDTNEYASLTETVEFVEAEDVIATGFVFQQPIAGTDFLKSTFKTSPALNHLQSDWVPVVQYSVQDGRNFNSSTETYLSEDPREDYDTTTSTWVAISDSNFGDVDAGYYGAMPYLVEANGEYEGEYFDWTSTPNSLNEDDTFYFDDLVQNDQYTEYPLLTEGVTAVVTANFAAGLIVTGAGSDNVLPVYADDYVDESSNDDTDVPVRVGTESVSLTAKLVDASGAAIGAGKQISVSFGTGFKVNGAASPVTVLTNASGEAVFTISKNTPTSAGSVELTFSSATYFEPTDWDTLETVVEYDWQAANYDFYNLNDNNASDVDSSLAILKSQSIAFNMVYQDQWDVKAPAESYRIRVTNTGATGSPAETFYNGSTASFSVSSNGAGTGNNVITTEVVAQKLTGASWGAVETETLSIAVWDVAPRMTWTADNNSSRTADIQEDTAVAAFDSRTSNVLRNDYSDDYVYVGGRVVDSVTGIHIPRAKVTISGDAGFLFTQDYIDADGRVEAVDKLGSITVTASSDGYWWALVASNKAVWDSPITATSNGVSITTTVSFLPVNDSNGADVQWKNPTSVKAGKTLAVQFKVVDKFGNPVLVADSTYNSGNGDSRAYLRYSGPGLLVTPTTSSDSGDLGEPDSLTGYYTARVLMGAKDYGIASFTVSYWQDNDQEVDRVFVTETIKVWVGPIVDVKAGAKKGRVVVDAYRAKGQTVNVFVKGTKVASFVADKAEDRFVVKGIKSGSRNVTVKIVGPGKDTTKRVTVK